MSYLLTSATGDQVAQHHGDPHWAQDRRLTTRCVRVFGRDPNTSDMLIADGPLGLVPDQPSSVGYHESRAVWYASGAAPPSLAISRGTTSAPAPQPRVVAAWADAWPGVISKASSGTTSDPYKSRVVSKSLATPAYAQDPSDPAVWLPDTGFLPQRVAVAGGVELAAGTPVIVLPFSIATEQMMAAIPASTQLVAVWAGGAPQGSLGTLEHDVKPDGSLDVQRRARLQSTDRIYRLPTSGLLPFGANPGAGTKPFPVSSAIAWQLGLDVDGQAGYGAIVDLAAPPPPVPDRTPTGINTPGPGTHFTPDPGHFQLVQTVQNGVVVDSQQVWIKGSDPIPVAQATGSIPTTTTRNGPPPPTTTSAQSVIALTSRRAFGGHSVGQAGDIHQIATTPDGEPVNAAHWNVLQSIDGDGFDAPAETSGVYLPVSQGGPLNIPVDWRYDPDTSHEFIVGNLPGKRRWQTTSAWDTPPPTRTTNPVDDRGTTGGSGEQTTTAFTEGTSNPLSESTDPTADGPNTTDPASDSPLQTNPADDFNRTTNPASDRNPTSPVLDSTLAPVTTPVTDITFAGSGGPENTVRPPATNRQRTGGGFFTFGGGILYNEGSPLVRGQFDPSTAATIMLNRGYARTPLEVAAAGFLARPAPCHGPDPRGRTEGLTQAQQAAYNAPAPIAGVLSAVGSQVGGSPNFFNGGHPGTALYPDGLAASGGFAFHPANVDIRALQAGSPLPPDSPTTTFFAATRHAQFAVADPTDAAKPKNGFAWGRDSNTSTTWNFFDNNGVADGNPGLRLDASAQDAFSWGGELVNGKDGSAGQVPIAVGDGTVTWGPPSAAASGSYGDGSDGPIVADGTTAYVFPASPFQTSGSPGSLVYTLERDAFLTTLVVSAGVTVLSSGYRIFANVSVTNNGTIKNDYRPGGGASIGGQAGTLSGGGEGAITGTSLAVSTTNSYGGGGGNGGGFGGNPAGTATAPLTNVLSIHAYPQSVQFG